MDKKRHHWTGRRTAPCGCVYLMHISRSIGEMEQELLVMCEKCREKDNDRVC
ncbi:hypothetical protein [Candidatus Uabimicrobium amorphum]|uniref:hypothetical protein n=1 Tax=Uabimicrobium amorphum TaxID=2596890 RepID=UPI0015660C1C|nr:hypothetical protein [Candidatus Uabimicrobium amorphum]